MDISSDKDFNIYIKNELVKEINERSLAKYPIVTFQEISNFLDDVSDYSTKKTTLINKYGNSESNLQTVAYFMIEHYIKRYFNEVLKYVNYERKQLTNVIKIENNIIDLNKN